MTRRDRRKLARADWKAGWRLAFDVLVVLLVCGAIAAAISGVGGGSSGPSTSPDLPGEVGAVLQGASRPDTSSAGESPFTTAPSTTVGPSSTAAPASTAPQSSTTTTVYVHPIADPVRIVIPAIDVEATIVRVGVQGDGTMEVPDFGLAGWFYPGPAPGASGPAVVVAHVDTKNGPDVFYRLKELKKGALVRISSKNGDTATFAVDWSESVLKTELPTERIWQNTREPVIRLVTCGGEFDRSTGHYKSNTIVYGHLVE